MTDARCSSAVPQKSVIQASALSIGFNGALVGGIGVGMWRRRVISMPCAPRASLDIIGSEMTQINNSSDFQSAPQMSRHLLRYAIVVQFAANPREFQ
ncbi:hypothetical protein AAFN47_03060 [Hoeflea sp. CAU 1731]